MRYDSADLDPRHVRLFLVAITVMWTIFHVIVIVKKIVERDYITLLIFVLPIAVNGWGIIKIIDFYKRQRF